MALSNAVGGTTFFCMRWLAFFLFLALSVTASAQTLVLGYSDSDPPPYYFVEGGNLAGGFFFDLGQKLAKQLGTTVVFHAYPRKRIEDALARGEVDALPFENPGWDADARRFLWSKPYFVDRNRILLPRLGPTDVRSAADLKGLRIGTILGYYYSTLDAGFTAGTFSREDVQTLRQNIAKLQSGRIDALVASEYELDWAVGVKNGAFRKGSWIVEASFVSMAVSPLSPLAPETIIKALDTLQNEGAIQTIWAKYQR
jgi:ABC-type amino acid transport substrate-binding protein